MEMYTNQPKSNSAFTNQTPGDAANLTWNLANFTWNQAQGTWNNPYSWSNASKDSSAFTNQAKN